MKKRNKCDSNIYFNNLVIPTDIFNCLVIIDDIVIAGSNKSLLYSEDNGKTWHL